MRNMIELAIEREAELLDAIIECPELVEGLAYPWTSTMARLDPLTRNFSARGIRRRSVTRSVESPEYLN